MSASDQLSAMLAEGRQHDALLNNNNAYGNYVSANNYYDAVVSDNPSAEEPNDWAKMLMSLAQQNNEWSAEQAQKQIDFQERMSNTAHVREIADLKAAGLNPVLSAKLGGASTPVGAMGTTDSSITGSIVQLMDKMLDVETDNAKMMLTRELANMSGTGSGSGSEYGLMAAILDLIPGVSAKQAQTFADNVGKGTIGKAYEDVVKGSEGVTVTNRKTGTTRTPNALDNFISLLQRALTGSNRLISGK